MSDIISECLKQLPDINFSMKKFDSAAASKTEKSDDTNTIPIMSFINTPQSTELTHNMTNTTDNIDNVCIGINNPNTKCKTPSVKCEVCNITLNSQVVYEQHLKGQKHLKKAAELNKDNNISINENGTTESKIRENVVKMECLICNIKVPGQKHLDMHLAGKKHLARVNQSAKLNKTNDSMESSGTLVIESKMTQEVATKIPEEIKCEVCNLVLVNKGQLEIHLKGKKHAKKLNMSTTTPTSNKKAENKSEVDTFAHLNIAWDKYRVSNQLISLPGVPEGVEDKNCIFEFYCSMCKKFMQRRMQLVAHLKSKKHHNKIQEKRAVAPGATNTANLSKNQVKKGLNKRPIRFQASHNLPSLATLKAGLNLMKPPMGAQNLASSMFQQPQQLMYQNFDNSSIQQQQQTNQFQNQATYKAAPLQYNSQQFTNISKRKGPEDSMDAKLRRTDTTQQPQTNFNDFMATKAEPTILMNTNPNMYQNLMNNMQNSGATDYSQQNPQPTDSLNNQF